MESTIRIELLKALTKIKKHLSISPKKDTLSPTFYFILSAINEYGQEINGYKVLTIGKIADILGMSMPALTKTTIKMERKSLVEKIISINDRRSRYIKITTKGEELLKASNTSVFEIPDRLLQKLGSKEAEHLVYLLNEVSTLIDK